MATWAPCGWVAGAREPARGALVWPKDGGLPPGVTPAGARHGSRSTRRTSLRIGAAQEFLHRVLRRDGVDRQAGSQLEAGDLAQARVDLPVPVVGRVDLLAQRGRVEHEVVGRSVEAAMPAATRTWRSASAVRRDVGWCSSARSPPRGGAARSRPRTASATRTGRRPRCRRPPRRAGPAAGPRRARAGRTGTPPRGSRSGRRRRAPRRCGAGSGAGRRGRGTGGWSGRRPGCPSSGRP